MRLFEKNQSETRTESGQTAGFSKRSRSAVFTHSRNALLSVYVYISLLRSASSVFCCLLYNVHAVRLAVFRNVKIEGVGRNTKVLGACRGVRVDWQVSFRLLVSCFFAEISLIKVQSRTLKSGFCPSPWGVIARGSSDQIFQIAVISEYVSKFG